MVKKSLVSVFIFFCLIGSGLEAGIDFGSRNSTIKITEDSIFHNSSKNFVVDGTIIQQEGATLSGNRIQFLNGVLEKEDLEAFMTAVYDPSGPISLHGEDYIDAQPGTVMQNVEIYGLDNHISGQPLFENEITLDSAFPSSLILAVQNALGSNLNLNTLGRLILEDNLSLADDVFLVGPGVVELNDRRISFGGYYSAPWASDLVWASATDIVLNGNTELSGTWTFQGISRINGNGHVLDLSSGGVLHLEAGAVLYMTDIHIRGVGDTDGKGVLSFADRTSQLRLYNTEIELVRDVETTTGSIYVEGPTTFILKDLDWHFEQDATLTVDGVTLWVDTLDVDDYLMMGQIYAPLPLYAQPTNLQYDFDMGNLDFINRGTVKYVCDRSEILPATAEILVSGDLHEDITLCQSRFIHPCEFIRVTGSCTIDGRGATLYFADTDAPQFIVDDDVSVTLKNLQMTSLHAYTFQMGKNSKIIIGENVSFETYDDLVWDSGQIILENQGWGISNVFYFRGMGGIKRLSLRSVQTFISSPSPLLILNQNTIALQDIELEGLEYITNSWVGNFVGAVGLSGGAAVNVEKSTGMSFFVSGLDNRLRILENKINFTGFLSHAEWGDNVLHFDFVLRTPLGGSAKNQLKKGTTPTIIFSSQFIRLTSTNGIARIIFDDASVNVENGANAFYVYGNSYLAAHQMAVSGDPIWDLSGNPGDSTSSRFAVEAEKIFASGVFVDFKEPVPANFDIPIYTVYSVAYPDLRQPKFFRDFDINETRAVRPVTAMHVAMAKEKGEDFVLPMFDSVYMPIVSDTPAAVTVEPVVSSLSSRPSRPSRPTRSAYDIPTRTGMYITRDGNNELREIELPEDLSGLNLPAFLNEVPRYENMDDYNMHNIDGNKILSNVASTNFSFNPIAFLNLSLVDGTKLIQGEDDTALVKDLHIVNIIGNDNEIQVTHNMTIGGDGVDSGIFFAQYSELTFRFINDGLTVPILTIESGTVINLTKNAKLAFKGDGVVKFEDGVVINMDGEQSKKIVGHAWVTTVSNKPMVMVSSDAQLTVVDGASATIAGVGRFYVTKKGRVEIDGTGHLLVGNETADDIETFVIQNGLVILENGGTFSLSLANHYLIVKQGGMITVRDGGRFELNLDNGVVSRGVCHKFYVGSHGSIAVDGTGRFAFCANIYDGVSEIPVDYRAKQGTLRGDGLVEFTDFKGALDTRCFVGKFVPENGSYDNKDTELEEIAKSWVQTQSGLIDTTVFVGEDGNTYFRTSFDALVQLGTGETVVSDDAKGNVTVSTGSGTVTYNKYGILV